MGNQSHSNSSSGSWPLGPKDLGRRDFLQWSATAVAGVLSSPAVSYALPVFTGCGGRPIAQMREQNWPVLVGFVEAQLNSLWRGRHGDDARDAAADVIRFISHLDGGYQQLLCGALTLVNAYSLAKTNRSFGDLTPASRMALLNQGESSTTQTITWRTNFLLHTAVSTLSMASRTVICSRPAARKFIGAQWSPQCRNPDNLVHVPKPSEPDLEKIYDVCIIGSGAGGAVMATRAAEAGLSVLIVEAGDWTSPDSLVQTEKTNTGKTEVQPPRGDEVLMQLYKGAGVQIAGGVERNSLDTDQVLFGRNGIEPVQTVNVIQAETAGGGPYVNNAIHLPISRKAWEAWGERRPAGISYDDLAKRMDVVRKDLGVNTEATRVGAGVRGLKFASSCDEAGVPVKPLPVSILPESLHCGSDNSVDPFGGHIGGVHPYRPNRPNSYLMRALNASTPAQVVTRLRAVRFLPESGSQGRRVAELLAQEKEDPEDDFPGRYRRIKAKTFVLSAGVGASTQILNNTSRETPEVSAPGLGANLTANVITAVYAVYDKPLPLGAGGRPEPGIAQCYYVDETTTRTRDGRTIEEPVLENWFHYPGTLAVALTGWFHEWVKVMRKYDHLSVCGMAVPTKVRGENRISPDGTFHLEVDQQEFELLLSGIEKIGRIYLAGAEPGNGVTLYLPTKAVLTGGNGRPAAIRSYADLRWALGEIRRRGPSFLTLATSHPQGGNPLGTTVSRESFRVKNRKGGEIENLYLADASLFPRGCRVNPQLTLKALSHFAADRMLRSHGVAETVTTTPLSTEAP